MQPPPYAQPGQPQPVYAQPPYPQPGYGYPPPQQIQQSTVVVNTQVAPSTNTVIVTKQGVNHCMHCCITFFFFPWIIVWIIMCITE